MKKLFAFLVLLGFLVFAFGCIGQNTQQGSGAAANGEVSKQNNEVANNQPVNQPGAGEKTEKTAPVVSEDDIPQIDDIPSDIDENFNGTDEI
jgi:hypothetical protein